MRKKLLHQFLRWQCWLHFLHRQKIFTVALPVNIQNVWLCVCSHDYHDVTTLPTNSYVPTWLSVNHWRYQLLSQSWVARVWCLWTLARRLMAARGPTTMMNCCWNDCCQRSTNYPILLFVHWQSWTVILQSKVCTHETVTSCLRYISVNIIQISHGSMGLLLK